MILSLSLVLACGDDDDDDDDDDTEGDDDSAGGDDDGATGGDDCESLCQRGFDCFGDEYWDYAGVMSMEECVNQCESDFAGADPELADCIFGCADEVGCEAWASCLAACAGY